MMMTPKSFFYSRQSQLPLSPTPSPTPPPNRSRFAFLQRRDASSTTKHISNQPASKTSQSGYSTEKMTKRKEPDSWAASTGRSPPKPASTTHATSGPMTPTSAVQIPVNSKTEAANKHHVKSRYHDQSSRRSSSTGSRGRDIRSPDALPPSVAALLAGTNIPPPNRRGSMKQRQRKETRMTVDSIVPRSQVSEKDLSQELCFTPSGLSPFSRSPLDVLLSPPDELGDEDASISDSVFTSTLSSRPGSFESLPSLGDSTSASTMPSFDSPVTPRSKRYRQPRRSLEPLPSPPGEEPDHPLSSKSTADVDQVGFSVFDPLPSRSDKQQNTVFLPFKAALKSNLTASIRVLRSAAKSISQFTSSSIPPEDLLVRSLLTVDPTVPFTDEKRPPVLEDEPTEAMRRYLNPTSSARLEVRTGGATPTRSYTASIQMQTYKVQRSRSSSPAANRGVAPSPPESPKAPAASSLPPGPRQREIRENSDFIRIAVMEHLMRKRGKLDDQREGHARWLLPPRQLNSKIYEIGSDGVPVRWISISQDSI
ncbi:uncharacterized protein PG998_001176 [Apiospora kogelbergensis]|uniref:uncharacterized protein n=1 Tax=Apiospora kogelbergensis TaxID=1337665 RepID=UPI003130E31A